MADDRIDAISALLVEAEGAHGVYESTQLGGVYDQAWPAWYAAYAVDHGIGALIGRAVTTDELSTLLTASWADFGRLEPSTGETWPAYTARRLADLR
jgi:hypothetical protein